MEVTNSLHEYTNKEIGIHKPRPCGWQKWTQMEKKDTRNLQMARTVGEIKKLTKLCNIIKNAFHNPTLCHNCTREVTIFCWATTCTVEILCGLGIISTMISGSQSPRHVVSSDGATASNMEGSCKYND
jgi:hypothetical protein